MQRLLPRRVEQLLRGSRPSCHMQQRRWLNLQEYHSKDILRKHGVTVQKFFVADSTASAREQLKTFQAEELVVKAQILAGGRGKGHFDNGLQGGVKITKDAEEAASYVDQMVGHRLVTKQTPKDGVLVRKVMICESVTLRREMYLAILLDRDVAGPVVVASSEGGVDIEEVAEKTPHLIHKVARWVEVV